MKSLSVFWYKKSKFSQNKIINRRSIITHAKLQFDSVYSTKFYSVVLQFVVEEAVESIAEDAGIATHSRGRRYEIFNFLTRVFLIRDMIINKEQHKKRGGEYIKEE